MDRKRCPFCHEYVEASEFDAHCAQHQQLREDGQQEEYVTLPPEDRSSESLNDEPRAYCHTKCGAGTQMPEEIVRSYLVNPYLYLADKTFCTGCGTHVPLRECQWIETGEDLQSHIDRHRAAKPEFRPELWTRLQIFWYHRKWIK